jgi:hypothetical protein
LAIRLSDRYGKRENDYEPYSYVSNSPFYSIDPDGLAEGTPDPDITEKNIQALPLYAANIKIWNKKTRRYEHLTSKQQNILVKRLTTVLKTAKRIGTRPKDLPIDWLVAVITAESFGDPKYKNKIGMYGLTQISKRNLKTLMRDKRGSPNWDVRYETAWDRGYLIYKLYPNPTDRKREAVLKTVEGNLRAHYVQWRQYRRTMKRVWLLGRKPKAKRAPKRYAQKLLSLCHDHSVGYAINMRGKLAQTFKRDPYLKKVTRFSRQYRRSLKATIQKTKTR